MECMRPVNDQWSVVALGQWNSRIFSPGWVGREVFHADEVLAEMAVGATGTTVRYSHENIILQPFDNRLIVSVKEVDPAGDVIVEIERVAETVFSLLSHTPVSGIGVNFGYVIDEPPEIVTNLFRFSDVDQLSDAGKEILEGELVRRMDIKDLDTLLNFKLSTDFTTYKVNANFHQSVSSANDAIDKIKDKTVRFRDELIGLMSTVYGVELTQNAG